MLTLGEHSLLGEGFPPPFYCISPEESLSLEMALSPL